MVSASSTPVSPLYEHALERLHNGDHDGAIALLEQAIEDDGARALYLCALARVHVHYGALDDAHAVFAQAVLIDVDAMTARDHYDRGAVLTALGRYVDAVDAYRHALARAPGWPLALDNLGVTLQYMGDMAGAERAFRKAIASAESSTAPSAARADIGSQTPEEQAWTLRNLGSLLLGTGRPDDAARAFERAIALAPDDAHGHHALATVWHAAERWEDAERAYRQAIALKPEWIEAQRHLGDMFASAGRPVAAEAVYRQVVILAPDDAAAHSGLSSSLNACEQLDEAIAAGTRAVELQPDSGTYQFNLGVICDRADRFVPALRAYRAAVRLLPDLLIAHKNLAGLLYRFGHLSEARAAYERMLVLDPDDETARHLSSALAGRVTARAPSAYVAGIFDGYADSYDTHMVDGLDYRGPRLIRDALARALSRDTMDVPTSARRWDVLDLGCGTGLMAHALADWAHIVHGVDVSSHMAERARARGVYDAVYVLDIESFLRDAALGLPRYDIVVAADVFVYLGDLSAIVTAVARRLSPGGVLAFSVEASDRHPFWLHKTGRYAHSERYLEQLASANGLAVHAVEPCVLRSEADNPVGSLIVILGTRAPVSATANAVLD